MPTEKKIRNGAAKAHLALSADYYNGTGGLTKEQFDQQHGAIWENMDTALIAAGHKEPPIPRRDLAAEVDELKEQIAQALEGRVS